MATGVYVKLLFLPLQQPAHENLPDLLILCGLCVFLFFNRCFFFFPFPAMESNLTVTSSQRRQFPTVLLAAHVHSNKLICLINREEHQGPRNRHKGIFFPSLEEKIEFDSQREKWKEEGRQRGRIAVSTSTADGDEICRGENSRKKERTDERGKKCQRVAKVGWTVRG